MKKLKLYLDTSILNFYYADDAPEKRDITQEFFAQIDNFHVYISDVVLDKVKRAKEKKKKLLYEVDALHVAIAVLNIMDVLVSWNLKHQDIKESTIEASKSKR